MPWRRFCVGPSPGKPRSLCRRCKAALRRLLKAHQGKVAVAVKHLDTGETFYLNADEVMPTASLIKFPSCSKPIMQAAEGKVKLDDMVTLKKPTRSPAAAS